MATLAGVDCTICFDPLLDGKEISTTGCHRFHTECITSWIALNATCPNCRGDIAGRVTVYQPEAPVGEVPPVPVPSIVLLPERNEWDEIAALVNAFVKLIFSLICCEDPEIRALA